MAHKRCQDLCPLRSRWINEWGQASSQGDKIEREIVALHLALGIHAERVPLSGAVRYQGNSADVDIYAHGKDSAPIVAEVKARKNGTGFVQLETWLGEFDLLFLRRNHADPLVVVPWRVWAVLLDRRAR